MWPRRSIGVSLAAAVVLLLAGGAVAWYVLSPAMPLGIDKSVAGTVALIRSWGVWGVLGSIALMIAHSFLPFPAEVVAAANGMIYGPVWGTVITWIGAMLGASAAFGLARLLGRPFVYRFLHAHDRQQLITWSHEHGAGVLLVCRFIPFIAFNLINFFAALTGISWWTFLWTTGVGILPLTILLATLGDNMLRLPVWSWLLLGAAAVAGWGVRHRRQRLASRRTGSTTDGDTAHNSPAGSRKNGHAFKQ